MAILVTLLLAVAVCYSMFHRQVVRDLKGDAEIISKMSDYLEESFFTENSKFFWEEAIRITWINEDGTVRYDTVADFLQMENHKERPEIIITFPAYVEK